MQSASDVMLGWVRSHGVDGLARDYYVRQLWNGKGSAIVESMKPSALAAYAHLCVGRWHGPMHALVMRRRSRRTPEVVPVSIAASRPSPKAMQTRTSGTTPR